MKKWQKWAIAICVIVVIAGIIQNNERARARTDKIAGGNIVRSLEISDTQVMAHKILEQNAENKNLACLGSVPAAREKNLSRMLSIIDKGGTLSKKDNECLDRVLDGPASLGKIIHDKAKGTVNGVKSVFAGSSKSQYSWKEVGYTTLNTQNRGWATEVITSLPSNGTCQIRCVGKFTHQFDSNVRRNIGCNGYRPNRGITKVIEQSKDPYTPIFKLNDSRKVHSGSSAVEFECKSDIALKLALNADPSRYDYFKNEGIFTFVVEQKIVKSI